LKNAMHASLENNILTTALHRLNFEEH